MALDCLDTLVGLTDQNCECISGDDSYYLEQDPAMFQAQNFPNQQDATLTFTQGNLPTENTAATINVYQQGQKLEETVQYSVSGQDITIASGTHYDGASYQVWALTPGTATAVETSGINQSDSGYYLTDFEYGFPAKDSVLSNIECGEGGFWNLMITAREQAIRDTKNDLLQALQDTRESKVINWRGLVGKNQSSGFSAANGEVGLQVRPIRLMKDGAFVIKAIHLNTDTAETYTVTISSNDNTFTEQTVDIEAAAGQWVRHELTNTISLPMYSVAAEDLRYNIRYTPGSAKPAYNKIWCCGRPPWTQHLDVRGFDTTDFEETIDGSELHGKGLSLEGYFTCEKLDWICDLTELNGIDFRDLIARCIQFRGASKLISRVLESTTVNEFTLMPKEGLLAKRNYLSQMYADNIAWIAQNLPPNVSGCWGCDKYAPKVTSLI